MISRTSSTPVLDAPSISSTSTELPAVISWQFTHALHGVGVGPRSQLSALASTRAAVVLPTPRTPVKRKACATRPARIAFASVRETCSCPTRSSNVCGRQRRADTTYAADRGGLPALLLISTSAPCQTRADASIQRRGALARDGPPIERRDDEDQ